MVQSGSMVVYDDVNPELLAKMQNAMVGVVDKALCVRHIHNAMHAEGMFLIKVIPMDATKCLLMEE